MVPFHIGHHLVQIIGHQHNILWCVGSAIVLLHPPIHNTRRENNKNFKEAFKVRNLVNECTCMIGWLTNKVQTRGAGCTCLQGIYNDWNSLLYRAYRRPGITEFHAEFLRKTFSTVCLINTPPMTNNYLGCFQSYMIVESLHNSGSEMKSKWLWVCMYACSAHVWSTRPL